ncbi:MAG: helix-turn-helix domain-containing protein [Polyangiaceae bacterium]
MSDTGVIEAASLGLIARGASTASAAPPEITRLEDVERIHIERILERVGGSRTKAAQLLGLSRSTLWEKLKRFGIS